jgi:hypothetical protein
MDKKYPFLSTANVRQNYTDEEKLKYFSAETLKSTERILEYCALNETKCIATLELLGSQTESLNRMDSGANKTNKELKEVEKNLHRIEKTCCCFPSMSYLFKLFEKPDMRFRATDKHSKKHIEQQNGSDATVKSSGRSGRKIQPKRSPSNIGCSSSINIALVTNDDLQRKISCNLVKISHSLSNLKTITSDISNEIHVQDYKIDSLNQILDSTSFTVEKANKIGERFLDG